LIKLQHQGKTESTLRHVSCRLEYLRRRCDAHANPFFLFDSRLTENTDSQFETFNLTLVSSWGG